MNSVLENETRVMLSSGEAVVLLPKRMKLRRERKKRGQAEGNLSIAARLRLLLQKHWGKKKGRDPHGRTNSTLNSLQKGTTFKDLVCANHSKSNRSKDVNVPGSFPLLVVTSSVGRAKEICRFKYDLSVH